MWKPCDVPPPHCSDEEDAETQCTTHIHKSIEYDDSNPEGYQVLADYYLIKAQIPVSQSTSDSITA